jgi:sigma-70-like protein
VNVVNIARMSLLQLRAAIQNNQVSFPAQVPTFACQSRADVQWRLVELFFVRNWPCSQVGERYGVTRERARQLIKNWVTRAIAVGYLQEIPAAAQPFPKAAMKQERLSAAQAAIAPALLSEPEGRRTGTRGGA